jgi:hypothetical protein
MYKKDNFKKLYEDLQQQHNTLGIKIDPQLEKLAHETQKTPAQVSEYMAAKGYKLENLTPEQYADIVNNEATISSGQPHPNTPKTLPTPMHEAEEIAPELDLDQTVYFTLELVREALSTNKKVSEDAKKVLKALNGIMSAKFRSSIAYKVGDKLNKSDEQADSVSKLTNLFKMVTNELNKAAKSKDKAEKQPETKGTATQSANKPANKP